MSHAETGLRSAQQSSQTTPAAESGISSGREVVGQALPTIMLMFVFALSIACLFIALATLAIAQEHEHDNEILGAANLQISSAHEVTASALDLASLPSLDSIDAQTDITVFLQSHVPEVLQIAALRRAWIVNPAIRDFKGLQEMDMNFNDPNGIPGFGEIGPEVDVKTMVAQILGDTTRLASSAPDARQPRILNTTR